MRAFAVAAACSLVLATANPVAAYYVRIKGKPHERMTAAAIDCLARGQVYPIKCTLPTAATPLRKQPLHGRKYLRETRWPDDPTRQSSTTGLLKFLANVGADRCLNYVGREFFAGLMCNSHYGTLQFFHAMSPSAGSEAFEPTRTMMLEWTALAFRVSTGEVKSSAPFCTTARQYGAAGDALAPAAFPFCDRWTVASLFGQTCSFIFNSTSCTQNNSEDRIRRAALGALLHMIQDSFSRSHVGRGESMPNGPFDQAVVRCQPVKVFYHYSLEQKTNHPNADLEPAFDQSCDSEGSVDPITASARMIWLAEHRCDAYWAVDLMSVGVVDSRPTRAPDVRQCRTPITS
ncbi:hypothetical protein ACFOKI_16425 [Sphingomonas qilianensis]|uniref:Uncharacterized protein n=1 Tax=Sphingomonas qilianensis TaxID=1736690 RepID=A0ABU9XWN7_9SPHN